MKKWSGSRWVVAACVAACLSQLGSGCSEARGGWIAQLNQGDAQARKLAIEALRSRELGDEDAEEVVLALLRAKTHSDEEVRILAERALLETGELGYRTLTSIICSDHHEPAARQLLQGGKDALPMLSEALARPDCPNRRVIALVLAGIGAEAVPSLLPYLKSGDPKTREYTLFALGEMGKRASAAIPALNEFRERAGAEQRRQAEAVLTKIRS